MTTNSLLSLSTYNPTCSLSTGYDTDHSTSTLSTLSSDDFFSSTASSTSASPSQQFSATSSTSTTPIIEKGHHLQDDTTNEKESLEEGFDGDAIDSLAVSSFAQRALELQFMVKQLIITHAPKHLQSHLLNSPTTAVEINTNDLDSKRFQSESKNLQLLNNYEITNASQTQTLNSPQILLHSSRITTTTTISSFQQQFIDDDAYYIDDDFFYSNQFTETTWNYDILNGIISNSWIYNHMEMPPYFNDVYDTADGFFECGIDADDFFWS